MLSVFVNHIFTNFAFKRWRVIPLVVMMDCGLMMVSIKQLSIVVQTYQRPLCQLPTHSLWIFTLMALWKAGVSKFSFTQEVLVKDLIEVSIREHLTEPQTFPVDSNNSPAPLPTTYLGCYNDPDIENRLLTGPSFGFENEMTLAMCAEFCDSQGSFLAGAQFQFECFCGSKESLAGSEAPEEECNLACAGNPNEICGAGNRMNIYHIGTDGNG